METVELLAPARDKICAKAAIDYGADAVYIASEAFGARRNASNSVNDIKEIVDYAHKFNVKVYVTLNTILTDEELKTAQILIKALEEIHVDAVIVQDFGLFSLKHKIPYHASTQCDISSLEKVKFLEKLGFTRVVLAREMSLSQIEEIRKNTNIELEVFVHGALCVCYSGQCYMSYAIGGRSANRGECAQPCRKKYTLIDEKGNVILKDKHLLALKDLNAAQHIKKMAQIGVKSFKIEGRLKEVNYVKNVVGYYRKLIDSMGLGKTSWGEVEFDFEPNLQKSFNRGFTDYFLEKRKDCFTFDSVNSKGEYIGKIEKIGKDFFMVKNSNLSAQDGLWLKRGGCLVNKVVGDKIYPNKMPDIRVGEEVFRNFDYNFEKTLNNSKTKRTIPAGVEFLDGKIRAYDEYGNRAEILYIYDEYAQDVEKMRQNIVKSFSKSGESIYKILSVNIETENIPFLPLSLLNELRRALLNNLEKRSFCYEAQKIKPADYRQELDYRANILNSAAEKFYQSCGCSVREWALESGLPVKNRCLMRTKHCIKYACGLCGKNINLYLFDEKNKRYKLKFDCKNCEMQIYN